jgi:hypothetical protein
VIRTRPGDTDEHIDEMVATRVERQVILTRDKPPMLWVVIDEGVLHRPIGSAEIMHDQLLHLSEMARRSNVVLQVVSAATGAYEGLRGPFILASFAGAAPDVVYQDGAMFWQFIEDEADIAVVAATWDAIKSGALPRGASLELVKSTTEEWARTAPE